MKTFNDLPAFLREKADIIENNLKKKSIYISLIGNQEKQYRLSSPLWQKVS